MNLTLEKRRNENGKWNSIWKSDLDSLIPETTNYIQTGPNSQRSLEDYELLRRLDDAVPNRNKHLGDGNWRCQVPTPFLK